MFMPTIVKGRALSSWMTGFGPFVVSFIGIPHESLSRLPRAMRN